MTEFTLRDHTILVVEDEYLLAEDLRVALNDRDVAVIGPAATVQQGIALLHDTDRLSGAILDVNLRGQWVFPLADELIARNVPFVFTTGYDASTIPARFDDVPRCEKPVRISQVLRAIGCIAEV